MKCIHLSDSHAAHKNINWTFDPRNADVIIHSGDFSDVGEKHQVRDFLNWFKNLPVKHKILIAGNHDKSFDEKFWNNKGVSTDRYRDRIIGAEEWAPKLIKDFQRKEGCYFLNHSSVTIDGIKFFGSPWTKSFHPLYWAFNIDEGPECLELWSQVPDDTDVLITHGPAYGKLDLTESGHYAGSQILLDRILMVKPKFHLFGHIHERYGRISDDNTEFLNSSIMTLDYQPNNKPQVFEINKL